MSIFLNKLKFIQDRKLCKQNKGLFKSGEGFSLIELMVAIGVLVFIMLISAPFFNDYAKTQDLKNSVKQFIGHLKEVQQYAVSTQIKHSATVGISSNNYNLVKKTAPDVILETRYLQNQVIFSSTTGLTNNEVVFNAAGGADESGEIILRHQLTGQQIKITVHPSGYVNWIEL